MKSLFEQMGGTYTLQGNYYLPDLVLPAEKGNRSVGIWGQRHLRYLKQHRKVLYTNLLTSSKLRSYLADIFSVGRANGPTQRCYRIPQGHRSNGMGAKDE